MRNFKKSGDVLTLTAPSGGVVSGSFYKIGSLIVVAAVTAAQGESFEAQVTGEFRDAPKTTSQSWSEGTLLYWVAGTSKFSSTASGNTPAAVATEAAGSSDTTGVVRLNGSAQPQAS